MRLKELWHEVDHFVVMESDYTFHGHKKKLWLKENIAQFEWAREKLHHVVNNKLGTLLPGQSPFVNENKMRIEMDGIVRRYARRGDLVLTSDVDEIPRKETIRLLRMCEGYPLPLHLQLKTYFYSFEFYFSSDDSWRAKVVEYDPLTFQYGHSKKSEYILVNSGEMENVF